MSGEELRSINRSLHEVGTGLSISDFTKAVEYIGGTRRLNVYVIPLTPPYCVLIARGGWHNVYLGKMGSLDPMSIPIVPENSEEYLAVKPEMLNSLNSVKGHLSVLRKENEYAEVFAERDLERSVDRIFYRFRTAERSREVYIARRREEKRGKFQSFAFGVYRSASDIDGGLDITEIVKRYWRYSRPGRKVHRRTEKMLRSYCDIGFMEEKDGRFFPMKDQLSEQHLSLLEQKLSDENIKLH